MANNLGCNLYNHCCLNTSFIHPVTQEPVFAFLDACHMLKLVRNVLGVKRCFVDEDGHKIKWSHIELLECLQRAGELHIANRLRPCHTYDKQQVMKVKLAA